MTRGAKLLMAFSLLGAGLLSFWKRRPYNPLRDLTPLSQEWLQDHTRSSGKGGFYR